MRKTNFSKSSLSACNARPVHTDGPSLTLGAVCDTNTGTPKFVRLCYQSGCSTRRSSSGTHVRFRDKFPRTSPRETRTRGWIAVSRGNRGGGGSAFSSLTETVKKHDPPLEDLVREALRPALKLWLDDNLPELSRERMVRAENPTWRSAGADPMPSRRMCCWLGCEATYHGDQPANWRHLPVFWSAHPIRAFADIPEATWDRDGGARPRHAEELATFLKLEPPSAA